MKLYLHSPGARDLVAADGVDPAVPLIQTLADLGHDVPEGAYVFLDNLAEPVDPSRPLGELLVTAGKPGVGGHAHLSVHVCIQIHVRVSYNGRTRQFPARPNVSLDELAETVSDKFGVEAAAAADLVFRIPGSEDDLPGSVLVGELDTDADCSLPLNYLPSVREAG